MSFETIQSVPVPKPHRVPRRTLMDSAKGVVLKLVKRDKPKKKKPSLYGAAGVYFLLK